MLLDTLSATAIGQTVGMPGISENHNTFIDRMTTTSDATANSDDSVCVQQKEDGSCSAYVKKYVMNKKLLEESLRALAYLMRTVYVAPEERQKSTHYPFGDKTIVYNSHPQYSQCVAFGGAEKDLSNIAAGMALLNQIDVQAEMHLRQQMRNAHYCTESIDIKDEAKIKTLQEKYLTKNETGIFIIPDCSTNQSGMVKQQISMLADQLYVSGTVQQALEAFSNVLNSSIVEASNNLSYRNTIFALDWIPPDLFGADPNYNREPLKLTMAFDRMIYVAWTDLFAKRFYCSPMRIGIRNDEKGEDFWKDFLIEIWNKRGIALDQAIEDVSKELLTYYEGDNQDNFFPSNSNYSNTDKRSRFFDYLTDKDVWVLHETDEFRNVCKDKYQNYLFGPVGLPDKTDDKDDYAFVDHEPLKEIAQPGFTVDGLIFESRERYLVKKLKTMTDEQLIEFRREFNLDNATTHINSAYYSPFTLYKRLLEYKQLFPGCGDGNNAGCRLKEVLSYLDNVGYDIDSDKYQGIEDKEVDNVRFKSSDGYRDLVKFLLPGGSAPCYDFFKVKKNEYTALWANNRGALKSETRESYELQQKIYGIKRRLHKLLDERLEFHRTNPENYMLSLYSSASQKDPDLNKFLDRTIFDVSDFTDYAANELMAPPPYASVISGVEYSKYFSEEELKNPISYHGLLSAAIAWIQTGFYDDVTDDYAHDTSRLKLYLNLRQLLGDYQSVVNQYSTQLSEDLVKSTQFEEKLNEGGENSSNFEIGTNARNSGEAAPAATSEAQAQAGTTGSAPAIGNFNAQGLGINIGSAAGADALRTAAPFASANLKKSLSGVSLGVMSGKLKALGAKPSSQDIDDIRKKFLASQSSAGGSGVVEQNDPSRFTEKFLALKSSVGGKLAATKTFSGNAGLALLSNFKGIDNKSAVINPSNLSVSTPSTPESKEEPADEVDSFSSTGFRRSSSAAESAEELLGNGQMLDSISSQKSLYTPKEGDGLFVILTKRYFISAYPKLLRRKSGQQ